MNKQQEQEFINDRVIHLKLNVGLGLAEAIKIAKKEALIVKIDEARTIEDIKEIFRRMLDE